MRIYRLLSFLTATILALSISGCTTTRYVTPWLRTTVTRPFELMAESGGPKSSAMTELDTDGNWKVVSSSARAIAIPNEDRAIFMGAEGPVVVTRTGERHGLDCRGDLRVDPMRKRLVCVEIGGWISDLSEDAPVVVKMFDYSAKQLARIDTVIAQGSLPRSYFPHFVGFRSDGTLILTVHVNAATETFAPGESKLCVAFALRSGRLAKLSSLETPSWPDCDQASFWNHHASLAIDEGVSFE